MSEQEQISQLSALFDGELPSQQADLVIRRAVKDPQMRQRWQRYALIGACLRDEPLAGADGRICLAERVSERIATEAEILAPWSARVAAGGGAGRGFGRLFGRGAVGGAIAAAVAMMAVFGVRSWGPGADHAATGGHYAQEQGADSPPGPEMVATSTASAPHSYTTPGENARVSTQLIEQQPLAHYVVAHSEQAAPSLGFTYDLTEGTVVMTADEIEAHLR